MPGPTPIQPPPRSVLWPQGEAPSALSARVARAVLLGSWVLLALLHQVLPPEQRNQFWHLAYLFLEILATASLAYRAQRTLGEGRLAWRLLALSTFLEVPNLLITFLMVRGLLPEVATAISNSLTLGTGLLALAGVLSFPIGHERGETFRRRVLDGLIFATSVLFLLWVMGVQGSLRVTAQGVGMRVLVDYANVACLGGGLVFLTSYHPDRLRGALGWLGASALTWLVAISLWTLNGLSASPAIDRWIVVVGGIPVFQGLAAWSTAKVEQREGEDSRHRLTRLLPYLPAVAAILSLATLLLWTPLEGMRGAFGVFLAMVGLLLLRQFQAILDLQTARRYLEERVLQRTKALEQAQDTLLRTERMNTMALMGAGLAHDLNNLLCAMKSSAELAAMNIEEGQPPALTDLNRIASTADRAAMLTRRLMGFVRREVEDLSPLPLGLELLEVQATLRLILPQSVELRLEIDPGGAQIVRSSRLRLEQMLVNLVANARDAMPEGGCIVISAGLSGSDPAYAMIEVADTGSGIEPDVLERIFDPFYTTKAPGQGTGLGLASLKAMVEEAEGRLEVASQPGKGSRFRILLPRVPEEGLSHH